MVGWERRLEVRLDLGLGLGLGRNTAYQNHVQYHAAKQNTKHESDEVIDGGQDLWTLCLWLCAVSPAVSREDILRNPLCEVRWQGAVVLWCCGAVQGPRVGGSSPSLTCDIETPEKRCPTHQKRRRTLPNLSRNSVSNNTTPD